MQGVYSKPNWLRKKIELNKCHQMEALLRGLELNTICQKALCPNISECFSRGEATFLILGNICTRGCSFCNVMKGNPVGVDKNEPLRVAQAVARLGLKHVVLTSVTRDDISDGGAAVFAATVRQIRSVLPEAKIEVLIPDLQGDQQALEIIVHSRPDIIGHNLETVPRLYPVVRQGASYERSLRVLEMIKQIDNKIFSKSGLMLGMGEEEEEIISVLDDLKQVKCDFFSIGQYLTPGPKQYPVQEYVKPKIFEFYKLKAQEYNFRFVKSGPYVRSSYLASQYLELEATPDILSS